MTRNFARFCDGRATSPEVRVVVALVAVVAASVGLTALREATLSRHEPIEQASRIELIARVEQRNAEEGQSAAEMFGALVAFCRLEVHSDPVGAVEEIGEDRFRAVLRPSMDASNRRQFRGCLEDWTIDQLRVDVLLLEDAPAPR